MLNEEKRFSDALKSIARNQQLKNTMQQSSSLFTKGIQRFIAGDTIEQAVERAQRFQNENYQFSIEYIGENTTSTAECIAAKNEFHQLIETLGKLSMQGTVSFDLSHLGLLISEELAFKHLSELATFAASYTIQLMISMEESQKTDAILTVYKKAVQNHANIGITLQAQLHRSQTDLTELLALPGKIRLVKGAYQEESTFSLPRSEQLNTRYIAMVEQCLAANHTVSIATHDEQILTALCQKNHLVNPLIHVEMLDGIRADLLKKLKDDGINVQVYILYGQEWYLYLMHRIAEYPPNLYTFLSDVIEDSSH